MEPQGERSMADQAIEYIEGLSPEELDDFLEEFIEEIKDNKDGPPVHILGGARYVASELGILPVREVSKMRSKQYWAPIEYAPDLTEVLCQFRDNKTIQVLIYIPELTLRDDGEGHNFGTYIDDDEASDRYCEEQDLYYWPAGWYQKLIDHPEHDYYRLTGPHLPKIWTRIPEEKPY